MTDDDVAGRTEVVLLVVVVVATRLLEKDTGL